MKACITEFFFYICAKIFAVQKKFQWAMPLHLERESHQNCKQDPVGLKFLKCAPFFVSWIEGTSCTLLSPPTGPVLSLHHSHHKFPTFTATLHSLTTPHTPPYSYFSPHNTLSTPHSLATHSPLSHHTFLTLTPHNPHPLTTPISQHTLPSVTTNSYILFLTTPHSLYSLDAPHTSNFHIKTLSHHSLPLQTLSPHHTLPILSPHTLHSLTSHSPLSHHTFSTFSPHTPHYRTTLSSHSLLSHPTTPSRLFHHTPQFLTSLPTSVPVSFRISLPTLSPHSLLFYFTSYSRTSLKSHSPLSNLTLLPHIPTFITLSTLSPHSPISRYTPHSHLISSPISHSRLSYLTPYTLSPPPLSPGRTLRWEMGCGLWALYTGKIFAHVLFSLSPALSAGKFRTGRIPMFQLFSLVHKCDFKTRRNCLQA